MPSLCFFVFKWLVFLLLSIHIPHVHLYSLCFVLLVLPLCFLVICSPSNLLFKHIAVTDFILKVNLTFIIRWNYTQTTITRAPMPNVHKSVICAKCTVPCERTNWSITVVWFPILLAFINNQSVGRPFQSLVQMGLLYMWHTRRLSHLCPGSLST